MNQDANASHNAPEAVEPPQAKVSASSARWRHAPWARQAGALHGLVTVDYRTLDGTVSQVTHSAGSRLASGSFANVYAGVDAAGDTHQEVVVKYLKNDAAYTAQRAVDCLLESVATRNPDLRRHFVWSRGWFRGPTESLPGGGLFRSQGVVQERADGGSYVPGDAWMARLGAGQSRERSCAAMGRCLATALLELNRNQPAGLHCLHSDIKPDNYTLRIGPNGQPASATIFDVGALRQSGRRCTEFEASLAYNDTTMLVDPAFNLDLQQGRADTQIDRHHTHTVAANMLVALTGVDDNTIKNHQDRLKIVEMVTSPQLRGILRASLDPAIERRPSLQEFRDACAALADPDQAAPAPAPARVAAATPPWWRRAASAIHSWTR